MAFDFSAIKSQKQQIIAAGCPKLICIMGIRGGGKSSIIGTIPKDKNTLILMTQAENHSYTSARGISVKKYGNADHLTPFFIDQLNDGKVITGDVVVGRLIELLNDENTVKFFPAIALDSLAALDQHILCCSEMLSADKFSSGKISNAIYGRIFQAIKNYVSKGGVFVYTLPTETFPNEDGVPVSTPKLRGSSALNAILGETPIITRVEKITAKSEDDESVTEYALAFKGGDIQKKKSKILSMTGSGKDMKITSTPITLSFSCRIAGVPTERIPDIMQPDLEELLALVDRGGESFES